MRSKLGGSVSEPGSEFRYSSLGMLILERTIEAATGKDFAILLHERILEPLKLKSTGYVYAGNATDQVLPLTKGTFQYSEIGGRIFRVDWLPVFLTSTFMEMRPLPVFSS